MVRYPGRLPELDRYDEPGDDPLTEPERPSWLLFISASFRLCGIVLLVSCLRVTG